MIRAARSFIVEQEEQQAALIEGLRASGDTDAVHLADKLSRCREGREQMRAWGGRPPDLRAVLGKDARSRCEHYACWSCRRKRIRDDATKGASRFWDANNRYCSHVTIADSTTGDLGEVRQRAAVISRGLRDRRDAAAETWSRWRAVEAIGHIELDPYLPCDIPNLAPDQQALIPSLPVLAHGGDGATWVIRAHLAVRHDGIGRGELAEVLGRQWPGDDRVHIADFFEHQLPQENAGAILSYSIKHRQDIDVSMMSDQWPVGLQVDYWSFVHRMRRGLQRLRISVGPQQAKLPLTPMSEMSSRRNRLGDDDPMPIVLGW